MEEFQSTRRRAICPHAQHLRCLGAVMDPASYRRHQMTLPTANRKRCQMSEPRETRHDDSILNRDDATVPGAPQLSGLSRHGRIEGD